MTETALNNSLAEQIAQAATGYEFPQVGAAGVTVRNIVAGIRIVGGAEGFLFQMISSAGQNFLVSVLRVRPQHNTILCPGGKDRNRPEIRYKRRIGHFTFLPSSRDGLRVPEDAMLADALVWREIGEEQMRKLLDRDVVVWEEMFVELYSAAGLGRRG